MDDKKVGLSDAMKAKTQPKTLRKTLFQGQNLQLLYLVQKEV